MVRQGKETKFWADVTADMMSEEERVGDVYVRHPPHYRSEKLNKFIRKLDERASKKTKSHARFSRKEGSPRKVQIPKHAKQWMIEAKPPQDEVESGTCREVDEPVGGDSVGGDPVGGDPVGGDPIDDSDELFSSGEDSEHESSD